MKKYTYKEEKACVIKFKNRRVCVQRRTEGDDEMFYIALKKVDVKDSRPVIFTQNKSPIDSELEITETGILINVKSAYALVLALQEMILLSDIPTEHLVLNDIKSPWHEK